MNPSSYSSNNSSSLLGCQIPDSLQSADNEEYAKLLYDYHVDSTMPSNLNPNWDYAFRVQSDTSNLKYLHAIPIYDDQDSLKHIVFIDHYSTNYAMLIVEAHYNDSTSLYNYLLNNDAEEGFEEINQFIEEFNELANCITNGQTAQVRCTDPKCYEFGDSFWDDLGQFFAGLWDSITDGGGSSSGGGGSSSGSGGIVVIMFDTNGSPSNGPSPTTSGGGGGGTGNGDQAFCNGATLRSIQNIDGPMSFIDQFITTYNLQPSLNLQMDLLYWMKEECVGISSNTCLLRSIGCQHFDGSSLSALELGEYWLDCYVEDNENIDECMSYKEEFHHFINRHMNNISVSELQSIVGLSCYDSASGELDETCVEDIYNANVEPDSDGIIDILDLNNSDYTGEKDKIPSCIELSDGTEIDVTFGVTTSDGVSADQEVAICLIDALIDALECASGSYTINKIYISATTNGEHSTESNHYKSLAIDLSRINGTKMALMNATELETVEKLQDCLENYSGIRENFGPFLEKKSNTDYDVTDHNSHIHFSIESDHTCSDFDINDVSCN